jgi:hypothetical protein
MRKRGTRRLAFHRRVIENNVDHSRLSAERGASDSIRRYTTQKQTDLHVPLPHRTLGHEFEIRQQVCDQYLYYYWTNHQQ